MTAAKWMENGQIALHAHYDYNEDRGCVAQSVDEVIHFTHEFSKYPTGIYPFPRVPAAEVGINTESVIIHNYFKPDAYFEGIPGMGPFPDFISDSYLSFFTGLPRD